MRLFIILLFTLLTSQAYAQESTAQAEAPAQKQANVFDFDPEGLKIVGELEGGIFEKIGLRRNDVIIGIDGHLIKEEPSYIKALLIKNKIAKRFVLKILRPTEAGETKELNFEISGI